MVWWEAGGLEDNVLGSELDMEEMEEMEEVSSHTPRHLLLLLVVI